MSQVPPGETCPAWPDHICYTVHRLRVAIERQVRVSATNVLCDEHGEEAVAVVSTEDGRKFEAHWRTSILMSSRDSKLFAVMKGSKVPMFNCLAFILSFICAVIKYARFQSHNTH